MRPSPTRRVSAAPAPAPGVPYLARDGTGGHVDGKGDVRLALLGGFGRIVLSEIEAPNTLADMV
jgi:hypothetical protein